MVALSLKNLTIIFHLIKMNGSLKLRKVIQILNLESLKLNILNILSIIQEMLQNLIIYLKNMVRF